MPEIIQADGKFILPGFADMHVHWQHWMPELFLAHGVTSAVDLESGEWTLAQRDLIRGWAYARSSHLHRQSFPVWATDLG